MEGDVSMWGIDTAFSRLYDKALERKLLFRQPAVGIRHGGLLSPIRSMPTTRSCFP